MNLWRRVKDFLTPHRTVDPDRSLEVCQKIIGHTFNDPELLRLSLSHRSITRANGLESSNERLEFLGDSVLGLIVAAQLYEDYPEMNEGDLTKLKAMLVNETTLSMVATEIGLNECILVSDDEARSGGRQRPSIVADAFESVIGAVYLDGGDAAAKDLVLRAIYARRSEIVSDKTLLNFKGELLEWSQANGKGLPNYQIVSEEGPDHDKTFRVSVLVGDDCLGSGGGCSKKEAEQNAARDALRKLGVDCRLQL